MTASHLRLSIPCLSINQASNNLLSPIFGYVVECTQSHPNTVQPYYRVSFVKNVTSSFVSLNSSRGLSAVRVMHVNVGTKETYDLGEFYEQKLVIEPCREQNSTKESQANGCSHSTEGLNYEDFKEMERRRKIGLANKGRVPWNKGRAHSAETRARIRQRTKEALRDPKVRQKMIESPRAHSNQTKARIRSSLRRLWGERLKWKRSREQFVQSWAESIADAAKEGGFDQQELDWDSYETIKKEIALQQLQWAVEKAKKKEMARIRAERAAQEKAEKIAKVALKRKEQEERAKIKGETKTTTRRKSKEEREESAVAQESKLKERLTKLHKKKSINGQFTSQDNRPWEKLDLEFMKKEQAPPTKLSLADQILAAKRKRARFIVREAVTTSSSAYLYSENSGVGLDSHNFVQLEE